MVAVLRDGNIFLFSRRARPEADLEGWGVPCAGGHVKPGDNAEEAVAREAKEEVGLDVKVLRPPVCIRGKTCKSVDSH